MPAKVVYLTDGPSRTVKIGNQEIHLRHTTPRSMGPAGRIIGAVARHLAEAAYHVWTKEEPYRDPVLNKGLSTGGVSAMSS